MRDARCHFPLYGYVAYLPNFLALPSCLVLPQVRCFAHFISITSQTWESGGQGNFQVNLLTSSPLVE